MIKAAASSLILAAVLAHPVAAADRVGTAAIDYMKAPVKLERVLDWGSRPVWSPDSKRIAFTKDDQNLGPAYEMDVATRKVRCLTCRFGANGHVARIYYLLDGSYLIEAPEALETAEANRSGEQAVGIWTTHLYWMPADASLPPQSLGTHAFGEIAIDYDHSSPGETRIAWGELQPKYAMKMGRIVNDGKRAFLTDRTGLHTDTKDPNSRVGIVETYDFIDAGKSVLFFTVERGRPFNGMYKLDIATGRVSEMISDGQHSEIHTFPDTRWGLEETNRASDHTSPYRGMSGHKPNILVVALKQGDQVISQADAQRYGGKTFDLYINDLQTGKTRRLTDVSEHGGEAHQSSPARDGKSFVYSLRASANGPDAGKSGLYIGTFSSAN